MEQETLQTIERPQRIVLLTTASSYRAEAFTAAAERLGIEAVTAVDTPATLAAHWNRPLGLDFRATEQATAALSAYAAEQPVAAIIAVDDSGSMLAAYASAALGLPHNGPLAAVAARNKYVMRTLLARGGVQIPQFRLCTTNEPFQSLAAQVEYPCVVKPLELNGSRGVIRADTPEEFVAAAERVAALLRSIYATDQPPLQKQDSETPDPASHFLVEAFIPGFEVALEGILDRGRLQVLALFDKPDPLDGPFFEETIYVTPSRLAGHVQQQIIACAAASAAALGLHDGPMHAELRVNEQGAWLVEVAGRSIGGLCSKTLQFGSDASLEELILRQACGLTIPSFDPARNAGGVMMIPIPGAGVLRSIEGLQEAEAVAGIESIEITAKLHYPLVPLPEGDSYLGFIFARDETPAEVEAALREAHARLHFSITPNIVLQSV